MKIHLPNGAFLGNIDQFLNGFDPSEPDRLSITAVENWMWLHPVALSMVAALGLTLEPGRVTCPKILAKSGHYLERMGLFKFLNIDSGMTISEHDPSGRFIPLTQIKSSEELSNFIREMVPMLHLEPHQAEPIRYIISELARNVLEHSRSENGAILCAQFFPKSNMIRLGIADTGIGIRTSLNRSHRTTDDLDAIKLALIPGVTGTTAREGGTAQNAGAGLFFTKSIAFTNHNFFVVYSGQGMYKLLRRKDEDPLVLHANPNLDRHSEKSNLPNWQGTVIGIDISLDSTSEFNALLDLIRDTYGKAIRERKESRYKRAAKFE